MKCVRNPNPKNAYESNKEIHEIMVSSLDLHVFLMVFIEFLQDIYGNIMDSQDFLSISWLPLRFSHSFLMIWPDSMPMPMARPGPKLHFGGWIPGPVLSSLAVRDDKDLLSSGRNPEINILSIRGGL